MSASPKINDDGTTLFKAMIDAAEELRALWHKCSLHPALKPDEVILTTNMRAYPEGPSLELFVDCEAKTGKAYAWCAEVRIEDTAWTVERTVRMNDAEGQHVLIELKRQEFSSSRHFAQELPLLIKELVETFDEVDLAGG